MSKHRVWTRLKKDETEVYGQPMLQAFLATTNSLLFDHWNELDEESRCNVGPGAVTSVLRDSLSEGNDPDGDAFRTTLKSMCKDALNRLQAEHALDLMTLLIEYRMVADCKTLGGLWAKLNEDDADTILCHAARNLGYHNSVADLQEIISLLRPQVDAIKADRLVHLIVNCRLNPRALDSTILKKLGPDDVLSLLTNGSKKTIFGYEWDGIVAIAQRLRDAGVQAIWRIDADALKSRLKSRIIPKGHEELHQRIMDAIGEPGGPK